MTAMLSGAEMVVQSLIEESVEQIFGYPGGSVLDIYDALHAKTDQIKHVLVRHEQAATPYGRWLCASDGQARSRTGMFWSWCNQYHHRYCDCIHGFNSNDCYLR